MQLGLDPPAVGKMADFVARGASQFGQMAMERALGHRHRYEDDDLLLGGVFVFAFANRLAYHINEMFEAVSALAAMDFLTKNGLPPSEASTRINSIIRTYNDAHIHSLKYVTEVGSTFAVWVTEPDEFHIEKLAQLFETVRKCLS